MAKFAFSGPAEKWKDFFNHATLGFKLRQLLVEVLDGELYSSATTEGVKHTWITVMSTAFTTQKTGEFVVNVPTIKDSLAMMKNGVEYIGMVDGNKLVIQGGGARDDGVLAPVKAHKAAGSYVKPSKHGKRQLFNIVKSEIGVPTIAEPPQKGEKGPIPLKQLFSLDANELKSLIKDTKVLGSKDMMITTKQPKDDERSLLVSIAKDDKTLKRVLKIPVEGEILHDWQQKFATQHIESIVALCEGEVFIGMTDRNKPGTKVNPGLWFVTNSITKDDDDEIDLVACYLVNTINPEKK